MSKQNFLHLKPHLVLGEAKVGSNWVNYQRASPREHLLNRLPQAHITRRRMQLSFGGAKIGTPSFEPGFHPVIQFLKLAWKNQCFRNISVDCWSVFCQASAQKFPRGHIVYWNYISISNHNTWWMVMVLSERGWQARGVDVMAAKVVCVSNFIT